MKYASKFGPAIAALLNAAKHIDDEDEDKLSYWAYFAT